MSRFGFRTIGDVINDFYDITPLSITYGNIYNPETHKLVLKDEYVDKEISRIEDLIQANQRDFESSKMYYKTKEEQLKEQLERVKKQRSFIKNK
jgi:hypothetical protein